MRHIWSGIGIAAMITGMAPAFAQDMSPPPPPPGGDRPMHPPRWPMTRAEAEAKAETLFARIDTNHDGVVTRAEYDAFEQQRRAEREARMKAHRDAEFARLDANKDGSLSPSEFDTPPPGGKDGDWHHRPRGPMGGFGPRWFDEADTNHDGQITLAEAKAAAGAAFDRAQALRQARKGQSGPGGAMPPPPAPPQS